MIDEEKKYEEECVCGGEYENNCAHFLSNWLIEKQDVSKIKNLSGCKCCSSGRPIRARELRDNYFVKEFGKAKYNQPSGNSFVYCEGKNVKGERWFHVYYGTKNHCEAGQGSGSYHGATYYEFYY